MDEEEAKRRRKINDGIGSGGGEVASMTSIFSRLFYASREEEESTDFLISDPSNFRKVGMTLSSLAGGLNPSSLGNGKALASEATPTSGPVPRSLSASDKPASSDLTTGLSRGIKLGSGGWVKRGLSPLSLASALSYHSSGTLTSDAPSSAETSNPYTASSILAMPRSPEDQVMDEIDATDLLSKIVYEGSPSPTIRPFLPASANTSIRDPREDGQPTAVLYSALRQVAETVVHSNRQELALLSVLNAG